MTNPIPTILQPHILNHRWDVRKVWALTAPVQTVPVDELGYLLDLPIWSSRRGAGMLFDCTPRDVLRNPSSCPYQFQRIVDSDLRFPMDFIYIHGKRWILDGVHRLAHRVHRGDSTISIRVHDASVLDCIAPDPVSASE